MGCGSMAAIKVPFRVKDALPILPRQISWPVMNTFHSAVDLLPAFVGSVVPEGHSLTWKGACFFENEARLGFTESDPKNDLGGGVLYVKARHYLPVFYLKNWRKFKFGGNFFCSDHETCFRCIRTE